MRDFCLSSAFTQMLLLIVLFLTLVLSLFLQISAYGRQLDKWKRYVHLSLFLFFLILLSVLADVFSKISEGLEYKTRLPLPMCVLWLVAIAADFLIIWDLEGLFRMGKQEISRDSIKQALDMLPSAICYFNPSGRVKLCNRQMDSLFHILAKHDLQKLSELHTALSLCNNRGIIRLDSEKQYYLFPDGKAWRYHETKVKASDGVEYTEAIFSDVTELYNRNLELKEQIKRLNAISLELKRLSDNALVFIREKEVLTAKTKLHDDMGAGLIAIRHILYNNETQEAANAVDLFRRAVSAIKYDNAYPQVHSELDRFLQDAEAIGIKTVLSGELPEQEELRRVMILAMRECLTNSVRHAGATALNITIEKKGDSITAMITNDGRSPDAEVVPKGGLKNLYRHIVDCGGTMEIQSKPGFALTVVLPEIKEGTE